MSSVLTPAGATSSRPSELRARTEPLLSHYLVERELAPEQTSGGIWLPQGLRERWTQGQVLKVGPGYPMSSLRTLMWAEVGEHLLFQKEHFRTLGGDHRLGMVKDEHLVGIFHYGAERFEALNDWVQVVQDPDVEAASEHIIYAEEDRPKPCHGIVRSYGPGRVVWRGAARGLRQPVPQIIGWDRLSGESLMGRRVYWSRDCEMLSVGRETLEFVVVQADDLFAVEVPE